MLEVIRCYNIYAIIPTFITVIVISFAFLNYIIDVPLDPVLGYTYDTIWWLGSEEDSNPDESPAVLSIYYTYPDRVFAGQNFTIGVTFQYLKDNRALLDWIVFSKVSVGIKNYSELVNYFSNYTDEIDYPKDIDRAYKNISKLVSPGQQVSYSFTMKAPTTVGKYVIFPVWNAFYGPGTTVTNNFDWNLEYYYNQTQREYGGQHPDRIPPIEIISRDSQNPLMNASLDVLINSPYSSIKPIKINVTSIPQKVDDYSLFTNSIGYALFNLPINHTYILSVPKVIDIVEDKIRAIFVNWTDGHVSQSHINVKNDNSTNRIVKLEHDMEFVPLYKTQYYLDIRSQNGINSYENNGTGWYDSGVEAQFAANTFSSIFSLYSFDHWNGTISKDDNTGSSGVITMNGPKELTAIWKFDFGHLGAYLGIVSGSMAILGKVYSKHHSFKKFFIFSHKR
jgi:hypothetical protein